MIPSNYRGSRIIVNLDAITTNIKTEINRLDETQELFAVVKANGYGHGAVEVAKAAILAGAKGLCVSNLDEALELREAGITEPVIVLSFVSLDYIKEIVEHNITVTAPSFEWLTELSQIAENSVKVHLKIDTGMGRIGLYGKEEMIQAKELIDSNDNIMIEGIFTHFSTADTKDTTHFERQQERFVEALSILGENVKYIHTSNSATALWHGAWKSNLIRYGNAMYGMNPSGHELETPFHLKQALTLESEIIRVKKMKSHEKIGYGATYETKEEEWIGTLPIGYADGLIRKFQGYECLVNGQKAEIVGRVCMDQCMIRLPEKVEVGTKVTIFGLNNGVFNSVQSGAEHVGTINYEITCGLTDRLPRFYTGGN
ncbi:alanine racemase [Vagococcus fluvialis]|uniref:alanine racemase n=1 Tax=Vagococcus fluvialis TaxID=2738 RepID=UPI003D0B37C9